MSQQHRRFARSEDHQDEYATPPEPQRHRATYSTGQSDPQPQENYTTRRVPARPDPDDVYLYPRFSNPRPSQHSARMGSDPDYIEVNFEPQSTRSRRTETSYLLPGSGDFLLAFAECYDPGYRSVEYYDPGFRQRVLCTIEMPDLFTPFYADELDKGDSVWNMVVLVGNALALPNFDDDYLEGGFWATTCEDYARTTWPSSVDYIQKLFSSLIPDDDGQINNQVLPTSSSDVEIVTKLTRSSENGVSGKIRIKLNGPVETLSDLAEALAWLSGTIQILPQLDRPFDLNMVLKSQPQDRRDPLSAKFDLLEGDLRELEVPKQSDCWTSLFPQTPCQSYSWTPGRRPGLEGVEMSFELMCFLGGLQFETIRDDGIILYGMNSFAYPVRQIENSIQWHFESFNPKHFTPEKIPNNRLKVSHLELLSEDCIHYVGLWKDVRNTLGSEGSNYSTLTWSNAEEVLTERNLDGFSIGGTLQFPKVLQLNYTQQYKVAKSRKNQYMVHSVANLHRNIGTPVLIYSPREKRGWIVSYVSVLLYLLRARASVQQDLGFYVPGCAASENGGLAAFECLRSCHRTPITRLAANEVLDQEDREYTIGKYADEVQAALELARRETCRASNALRRVREKIIGFELADIAKMKPKMRMKQHKLDKFAPGCWAPLLDEIQYTFFCEGLPDPILPGPGTQISMSALGSSSWATVPKGHNILTASLPVLASMIEDRNHETLTRVTADYYWHMPDRIFDTCADAHKYPCSRMQEMYAARKCTAPGVSMEEAKANGAVCFRYKDEIETITSAQDRPGESAINDLGYRVEHMMMSPSSHRRERLDSGYSSGGGYRFSTRGSDSTSNSSSTYSRDSNVWMGSGGLPRIEEGRRRSDHGHGHGHRDDRPRRRRSTDREVTRRRTIRPRSSRLSFGIRM